MTTTLRERVRGLPKRPGVYLFTDGAGRVLYVGKAHALKTRVGQYCDAGRLEPAKRDLVRRATDVRTIVTKNDAEALALEATLIQRHDPPYNVRLVDDSSYLYLRISAETYPKVELVRRVQHDGAWYRGPYPVASAIRLTLREARKMFPWCAYPDPRASHGRPCFAYHLGLCPGICVERVSVEEYHRIIEGLKRFLDGETRDVLHTLRARMAEASARQEYERAAHLRNALTAIENATLPQHVATARRESVDALGVARRGTHSAISVLSVRDGQVVGSRPFSLLAPAAESTAGVLRSFLLSYLPRAADGVRELLLPEAVEDAELLTPPAPSPTSEVGKFPTSEAGKTHPWTPRIHVPRRGWKRRLLDLARTNAEEALALAAAERTSPAELQRALQELARALRLPRPPHRIEAYDISNIQGTLATASLVVFLDGRPARRHYRKFKITTVTGSDDVGMMREVLRRRFARHAQTRDQKERWPLPDLVILDGGKGQLNAGSTVLKELGLDIPLAALAKREEELFVPARAEALRLPPASPALFLLQRIRDEAHRFTLGYHQLLRKKRMTKSILEEIPGVGDATRKKLLRSFGSLRGIREAPPEELAQVVGAKRANTIQNALTAR